MPNDKQEKHIKHPENACIFQFYIANMQNITFIKYKLYLFIISARDLHILLTTVATSDMIYYGMCTVTWLSPSTNHMHSPSSIPHFIFCILLHVRV